MTKYELIEQSTETIVTHQFECEHCGNVFQSTDETIEEFVSRIESEVHSVTSEELAIKGIICDDCFNDDDVDWQEID